MLKGRLPRQATATAIAIAMFGFFSAHCKQTSKIDGLRDALASDDAAALRSALEGLPPCPDLPPVAVAPGDAAPRDKGCLSGIADALGSKRGYVTSPPDEGAAAATAVVLVRDGRGDWIGHGSTWLAALRAGTGSGIDALRLAIATAMAKSVDLATANVEGDDAVARAAMKAVASSLPGACPTYWLLGTGTDPKTLEPPLSTDHSACIHADLATASGPGPGWGSGLPRALAGARALWRENAVALRRGLDRTGPTTRAALEKKLAIIESKVVSVPVPSARAPVSGSYLAALHADAGILLEDAGAFVPPPVAPDEPRIDAGALARSADASAPRVDAGRKH